MGRRTIGQGLLDRCCVPFCLHNLHDATSLGSREVQTTISLWDDQNRRDRNSCDCGLGAEVVGEVERKRFGVAISQVHLEGNNYAGARPCAACLKLAWRVSMIHNCRSNAVSLLGAAQPRNRELWTARCVDIYRGGQRDYHRVDLQHNTREGGKITGSR